MGLSGIVVVILGALLFFGGVMWLEIRSRKNNPPGRTDEHSRRQGVSKMTSGRAGHGREAAANAPSARRESEGLRDNV